MHRGKALYDNKQEACTLLYKYLRAFGMASRKAFYVGWSPNDYMPLIMYVSQHPVGYDFRLKDTENLIGLFNDVANTVSAINHRKYNTQRTPSVVAVTKVMMAVYGNVPAFDSRFSKRFREITEDYNNKHKDQIPLFTRVFNEENLLTINRFYQDNKKELDRMAKRHLRSRDRQELSSCYTIARLIDCYGWH